MVWFGLDFQFWFGLGAPLAPLGWPQSPTDPANLHTTDHGRTKKKKKRKKKEKKTNGVGYRVAAQLKNNSISFLYWTAVLASLKINFLFRFFETETATVCIDFSSCGPCYDSLTWAWVFFTFRPNEMNNGKPNVKNWKRKNWPFATKAEEPIAISKLKEFLLGLRWCCGRERGFVCNNGRYDAGPSTLAR